jgi:hypothetical protein
LLPSKIHHERRPTFEEEVQENNRVLVGFREQILGGDSLVLSSVT